MHRDDHFRNHIPNHSQRFLSHKEYTFHTVATRYYLPTIGEYPWSSEFLSLQGTQMVVQQNSEPTR